MLPLPFSFWRMSLPKTLIEQFPWFVGLPKMPTWLNQLCSISTLSSGPVGTYVGARIIAHRQLEAKLFCDLHLHMFNPIKYPIVLGISITFFVTSGVAMDCRGSVGLDIYGNESCHQSREMLGCFSHPLPRRSPDPCREKVVALIVRDCMSISSLPIASIVQLKFQYSGTTNDD